MGGKKKILSSSSIIQTVLVTADREEKHGNRPGGGLTPSLFALSQCLECFKTV